MEFNQKFVRRLTSNAPAGGSGGAGSSTEARSEIASNTNVFTIAPYAPLGLSAVEVNTTVESIESANNPGAVPPQPNFVQV